MSNRAFWSILILSGVLFNRPEVFASDAMARPSGHGTLHIQVHGLPSNDGHVKIGLYDSRQAYAAHRGSFRKAALPIRGQRCDWVLEGIPEGEYAVMFYHDRNGNQQLDRNRLGLPVEPYGFSNNATPRLGLPPYERVKFPVRGRTTIEIRTQAG